jgi:hypothetical protein
MNINVRFMLHLYRNGKALMRNFLTGPPARGAGIDVPVEEVRSP